MVLEGVVVVVVVVVVVMGNLDPVLDKKRQAGW